MNIYQEKHNLIIEKDIFLLEVIFSRE